MAFLALFAAFLVLFSKQGNGQSADANAAEGNFNIQYAYQWGANHFYVNPQGTEVTLKLDQYSGGAGFRSKDSFGSGGFRILLKAPGGNSQGLITSFFLIDKQGGQHNEVDFEFFGSGTKGFFQTNIFANDYGNREQKLQLWFDPSKEFHLYEILWNSKQIAFFVDKIPIRVFKNTPGLPYITAPMHVEASIWNASASWAGPVTWSEGPFIAHYSGFSFQACTVQQGNCNANKYSWNLPKYWDLDATQKAQFRQYRQKYTTYDYCKDAQKRRPLECAQNEI